MMAGEDDSVEYCDSDADGVTTGDGLALGVAVLLVASVLTNGLTGVLGTTGELEGVCESPADVADGLNVDTTEVLLAGLKEYVLVSRLGLGVANMML